MVLNMGRLVAHGIRAHTRVCTLYSVHCTNVHLDSLSQDTHLLVCIRQLTDVHLYVIDLLYIVYTLHVATKMICMYHHLRLSSAKMIQILEIFGPMV